MSLVDSTFLSMKMTAWRLIPSGPGYRYLDSWSQSWHVEQVINIIGLQLLYQQICDTFTVVVASQAQLLGTNPMCACMPVCFQRNLVKACPAQMIFITTSYSHLSQFPITLLHNNSYRLPDFPNHLYFAYICFQLSLSIIIQVVFDLHFVFE